MATVDLAGYGITGVKEIIHNPSYEFLFEEEMKPELTGYDKGQLTEDRKSTRLNSSHPTTSRMPSSA